MNVLILGSGGREHALAHKLSSSPICEQLFCAPGNGGIRDYATILDFTWKDRDKLISAIADHNIDMVVIGPEQPLAEGIVDALMEAYPALMIVGPNQGGARLESSKGFAKEFMIRHDIPTAPSISITSKELDTGLAYIEEMTTPIVLKADGLAAGKGVIIAASVPAAKAALKEMLDGQFGEASSSVVIETYLHGVEYSVFALTDGDDFIILPIAKDYKRIGEGDTGHNTGGMGAISPVSFVDDGLYQRTIDRVVIPTIEGLKKEDINYSGILFFGMISVGGDPFVIEYNCRLGDPETQVILPRIKSDLLTHFIDLHYGELHKHPLIISDQHAAGVVMVSGGYPESYTVDHEIRGLNDLPVTIYHAGSAYNRGLYLTTGGRVLCAVALGDSLRAALTDCYTSVARITFDQQYYRRDIGFDV